MTMPGSNIPSTPTPTEPTPPRHVTVFSVNWANVLDFTQLFKGFRLAINPAKIMIALAAILLIYCAGRVFDLAWGVAGFRAHKGEVEAFQTEKPEMYKRHRSQWDEDRDNAFRSDLEISSKNRSLQDIDDLVKHPRSAYNTIKADYIEEFHKDIEKIHEEAVKNAADTQQWTKDTRTPWEQEQFDRSMAAQTLYRNVEEAQAAYGAGIFDSFLTYEIRQFDGLVENTLALVRVSPPHGEGAGEEGSVKGGLVSKSSSDWWSSDTVEGSVASMAITGPEWLFSGTSPMQYRPSDPNTMWGWIKMMTVRGVYLLTLSVLALFCMVLLALAGAMIARLSAMELSGVDRAPLKEIFLFSLRRLWVFIKAPLMPFLIMLVIGCVMALVGVMGAIPWLGPVIIGIFFVGFIVVSFVIMLLLLGVLGGFNLLYPTIAVEGSDAFDAMSRSFAYVYARPWRLLFYTVVSLFYGVLTFLFVSFTVFLVLSISHTFVGWGTNLFGYHYGSMSGVSMMETLWPAPHYLQLITPTNWYAMSWMEELGSMFLHFWVYLLATSIGAYVISYYFSSNTIIYLLMRRSVDGQGIGEVFVDEEPVVKEETVTMGVPAETPLPPAAN